MNNSTDRGRGVPDLIKEISEKSAGFYIVDLGPGNEVIYHRIS